jgi:general secretion pathway protein G
MDVQMRKKTWLIMLSLVGFVLLAAAIFVPCYVTSPRERILQQDLFTMRNIVDQYTLDKHRRPQSLDDLVTAGYLKKVPTDPMTGRNDTWVVKCSGDRSAPGIEEIESGYGQTSDKAKSRCD